MQGNKGGKQSEARTISHKMNHVDILATDAVIIEITISDEINR